CSSSTPSLHDALPIFPSSYNDFIFSIIGEELGLIGLLGVLAIYAVILVCGVRIAERASDEYEKLLVLSMTFMIVLQAIIHMLVRSEEHTSELQSPDHL